ncbi:MAG TPA: endonuclease/exonuclease/phosphatase family protein [Urbifossiella sp.]|nr:endonuclease/exonuclease/phosphatase family protein [Urbifossiella sp.]
MAQENAPLRFAWWNLQDFAHYDPNHAAEHRWPLEGAEYEAKCKAVDAALGSLIAQYPVDIFGTCEITPQAASDLQTRLFSEYTLIYPDPAPGASFQTAVFYRRGMGFRNRLPLHANDVPRTTRGMAIVDFYRGEHAIRFIFCHWTSFGEGSAIYRERLAETVSGHIYEFLENARRKATQRHAIVIGDLNVEPFDELFERRLPASRNRARARSPMRPADHDTRRVKMYNAAWRHLGEKHPHNDPTNPLHIAGTYFSSSSKTWHTYDQILVTGSLLGPEPPFLEENSLTILPMSESLGKSGYPEKFAWKNGRDSGLSDHLPIVGRIVLPSLGGK